MTKSWRLNWVTMVAIGAVLGVFIHPIQLSTAHDKAGAWTAVETAKPKEALPDLKSDRRDDVLRLQGAGERLRAGMVLLAGPTDFVGTGFIISRKRRLIATAGHVADNHSKGALMIGVREGTRSAFRITRVWYHPGIIRKLDDGLYARSFDPKDGGVADFSLDVAVLEYAGNDREFPTEIELAADDELRGIEGQPGAILGYATDALDQKGERMLPPAASFGYTVIGKMGDAGQGTDLPFDQRKWVWFNNGLGPGASGSPVFLRNGHVAAVLCCRFELTPAGYSYSSCAIRSDGLRELLAYHRLDGPGAIATAAARREWGPDPRLEQFRQAVGLVRDAKGSVRTGEYAVAANRCARALVLAPKYGGALLERSNVYLHYLGSQWGVLELEDKLRYADAAFRDSYRCLEMYPALNSCRLIHTQNIIYQGCLRSDDSQFLLAVAEMNKMLREDWMYGTLTDAERSFATNCRAQCKAFLGEIQEAERDYGESIRLLPDQPRWYLNRADFWDHSGRPELATWDRRKAKSLSE